MGNYIYYSLVFSGIVIFSYLSYRSEKKQKNYYQKITSAYTMGWGATPSSHRVPTFGKAGEDSSAEGSAVHKNERSDTLGETPDLFLLGSRGVRGEFYEHCSEAAFVIPHCRMGRDDNNHIFCRLYCSSFYCEKAFEDTSLLFLLFVLRFLLLFFVLGSVVMIM